MQEYGRSLVIKNYVHTDIVTYCNNPVPTYTPCNNLGMLELVSTQCWAVHLDVAPVSIITGRSFPFILDFIHISVPLKGIELETGSS